MEIEMDMGYSQADNHILPLGKRPPYASKERWGELHDIMAKLWPDMTLEQLKKVMEDSYGFRATYVACGISNLC